MNQIGILNENDSDYKTTKHIWRNDARSASLSPANNSFEEDKKIQEKPSECYLKCDEID